MVKAKDEVVISPLFKPSSNSSPRFVQGASKLYLRPVESTSSFKLPAPYLERARIPHYDSAGIKYLTVVALLPVP